MGLSELRGRPRRSWALDASLAALVVLVSLTQVNPPALLLAALTGSLLLFRRIWPVPVNLAVLVLGLISFAGANAGLAIGGGLIALHTLAVSASLRVAVAGLLISEVWVVAVAITVDNPASDKLTILVGFSLPQALAFLLGRYRQTRDRRQGDLQERNRLLEVEREQRDLLAAADERARIAREMHDLIAHHLTVVVALSEGLARSGEITSERSQQAVTTTVSMARQALEETRRLLGTMPRETDSASRQPIPDLSALDGLVSQVRATGLAVRYEVEGELPGPGSASSGLQMSIYRLVQEALTNTMKHAHEVSGTRVRLRFRPEVIEILIEDDGRESAGRSPSDGLGRGLLGMRERVQSFGGRLAAGAGETGGWRVSASFPLNGGGPR